MSASGKPVVLAVTYGAGHVLSLLPALSLLAQDDAIELKVIGLSLAFEHLDREGIPNLGLIDFVDLFPPKALEYGQELVKASSVKPGLKLDDMQAYVGLAFWDLVQEVGEKAAYQHYQEHGRGGFAPTGVATRILEFLKPDLVISSSAPRYERAFLVAAEKVGIRSVILIDHMGITATPWAGHEGLGSKIAVISDFSKQTLVGAGRSSEDVVVTGNPGFDRIFSEKARQAGLEMKSSLPFEGKRIVLFAGGSSEPSRPGLINDIVKELEAIGGRRPDLKIVIRPHPNQLDPPAVDLGKVVLQDRLDPLEEVLHACDVVLTLTSTVAIQAALINKPVVQIELSEFLFGSPYAQLGIAQGISDLKELEQAIDGAKSRPCAALNPLNQNSTESFVAVVREELSGVREMQANVR